LGVSFGPEVEASYTYRDALGNVVFRKLRYPGKKFVCQRPTAAGGWENGLEGISTKPLYRLPELIRSTYAVVTEGEKDADCLVTADLSQFEPNGLPVSVTTNFDGAGHWRSEYNAYFAGRTVSILPDNDPQGEAHGLDVARGIYPFAAGVKIVKLPGLPEGGDVSDYLDSGHSVEDLIREIVATPPWRPEDAVEVDHFTSLVEIISQGTKQADWVIGPGYVERSAITTLSSKIKFGKSSLLLSAIRAVLEGREFLGHSTACGPVVMISEMSGSALISGLQRAGLQSQDGLWIMGPHKLFGLSWPQVVAAAAAKCKKTGAALLAIDTLGWAAHLTGTQENDAGTMMEVYRPLQQIAGSGFGIWTVTHERKAGGSVEDAARGSSAAGGSADILMRLGKAEGRHSETIRKISAIGRFSETPSDLVINWTPANEYVVLGNSDAATRDRAMQAILDVLPFFADTAKTRIVLQEETGESMTTIRRVLKELKAVRTGAGTKDDPFKYRRREIGGGKE
ncbi:MAG: AAA family ATPase, partial [Candidatus Sulfotelmatobacter sp.]